MCCSWWTCSDESVTSSGAGSTVPYFCQHLADFLGVADGDDLQVIAVVIFLRDALDVGGRDRFHALRVGVPVIRRQLVDLLSREIAHERRRRVQR